MIKYVFKTLVRYALTLVAATALIYVITGFVK